MKTKRVIETLEKVESDLIGVITCRGWIDALNGDSTGDVTEWAGPRISRALMLVRSELATARLTLTRVRTSDCSEMDLDKFGGPGLRELIRCGVLTEDDVKSYYGNEWWEERP
jgi:hypothetical protein